MSRTFPRDVVVIDHDSLLHVRIATGHKRPSIAAAKRYALVEGTFSSGTITPSLALPDAFRTVVRRVRAEQGQFAKVSVLLPDSWFRMNLLDIAEMPQKKDDADEMVRWNLKRTLPIRPEDLRTAWMTIDRSDEATRVFVVAALNAALASIESAFAAEKIDVVLIEPVGLNLWNAVIANESAVTGDRLFLYIRERDFTTGVFRGTTPLFVRSRNLSGERTLVQELKISAAYLKNSLQTESIERCYLAGHKVDPSITAAIEEEFGATTTRIALRDFVENSTAELPAYDAELTACTGVFAA